MCSLQDLFGKDGNEDEERATSALEFIETLTIFCLVFSNAFPGLAISMSVSPTCILTRGTSLRINVSKSSRNAGRAWPVAAMLSTGLQQS